ncbi:hypothetical protein C8R47DRAFT_1151046 [Mycena vitilis]|nr:hypothetical protein C8R47DRAFT_1151046 [Mycena vitilis]
MHGPRYYQGPVSLGLLPPDSFASYRDRHDAWQVYLSPLLTAIISRVQAALANPQSPLLHHYFFVVVGRLLTVQDQRNPRLISQFLYPRTLHFFQQRFPRIWLHDNMAGRMLRRDDRSGTSTGSAQFLLGAHDRGTHNGIIFLDKKTIDALNNAQNPVTTVCLTVLIVSTLFHELAHCFWTAVHGEDSVTPQSVNWNAPRISSESQAIIDDPDAEAEDIDPDDLTGESGFVVEGSMMGCEIWPYLTPGQRIGDVIRLVWHPTDEQLTEHMYIICESSVIPLLSSHRDLPSAHPKVVEIYNFFSANGYLGASPLLSLHDVEELVLRERPRPALLQAKNFHTPHGVQAVVLYRMDRTSNLYRYTVVPHIFEWSRTRNRGVRAKPSRRPF